MGKKKVNNMPLSHGSYIDIEVEVEWEKWINNATTKEKAYYRKLAKQQKQQHDELQ